MAAEITPRRAIKALLRGAPPSRPLLMPIIFSLGSRLENVTPRDFLSNPTKIANALRHFCPKQGDVENTVDVARRFTRAQNPIFLTSSADIPATADVKDLAEVLETMRSFFSPVASSG